MRETGIAIDVIPEEIRQNHSENLRYIGMYFDTGLLGGLQYSFGIGFSFFNDIVKFQANVAHASPGTRYSGWVFGGKLLADIFSLNINLYNTSIALGAQFAYFQMDGSETPLWMGQFLGQWEIIKLDMSRFLPKWKYFNMFSFYTEPGIWFSPWDWRTSFTVGFGGRIGLFTFPAGKEEIIIVRDLEKTAKKKEAKDEKKRERNSEKLTFGISAEPSGFALYGPSASAEFTKGNLNTQIGLHFPSLGLLFEGEGFGKNFGIGAGLGLNYIWHSRIGGFYLGGILEYNGYDVKKWMNSLAFALNTGYKFILPSGIYFRTGGNFGASYDFKNFGYIIRPDLSIGYNF
jgi:hypothetical protein